MKEAVQDGHFQALRHDWERTGACIVGSNTITELLSAYASGAEQFRQSVAGVPHAQLIRKPRPDKWSIQEIASHLADAELVYTHRIRKVAAERDGLLTRFDQDLWVAGLAGQDVPVDQSVQLVAAMRAWNLGTLQALPEDAFARTGQHETDGAFSVEQLLRKVTDHLLHHVRQIEALRSAG